MQWVHGTGVEGNYWLALPFAGLLVAILVVLAARRAPRAALAAVAAAAGFGALLWHLRTGTPSWDVAATAALHAPSLAGVAAVLAWMASYPFALVLLLGLALWPALSGKWREFYVVLGAGLGLALLVAITKSAFPRVPLGVMPFFAGPTSYPDDVAALAPAALFLHGLLLARRGRKPRWILRGILALVFAWSPVGAGWVHASDAVAGFLLALVATASAATAFDLLDRPSRVLGSAQALATRFADGVLRRADAWLLALIAVGVFLRLVAPLWTHLGADAYAYGAMAKAFADTGTFTLPWGDPHSYVADPAPSHHSPPLYPMFLAPFLKAFGYDVATIAWASVLTALGALVVVYACTRDLYGHRAGLVATAAASLNPLLIQVTGQGYSENLVLAMFAATLWAILRSLTERWFIVLAGIFAGLGYLTKSTMGPFFLVAGLAGFGWRLYWQGWKVLRDPAYLTAIAAFGALASAWMLRNIQLFGTWETSHHLHDAVAAALADPLRWGYLTMLTLVFYVAVGYFLFLGLLALAPSLARAPKLSSEHDSGLWLALGLALILSAFIDAALLLIEGQFYIFNVRYISFAVVPAAWLLIRNMDLARATARVAVVATFAFLLAAALFFGKPTSPTFDPLAADLGARMQDGQTLGLVDEGNTFLYRFHQEVTQGGQRAIEAEIACLEECEFGPPGELETDWILAPTYAEPCLPSGYSEIEEPPWDGRMRGWTLWERDGTPEPPLECE